MNIEKRRSPFEMSASLKAGAEQAVGQLENNADLDQIEIPNAAGMTLVREGNQEGKSVIAQIEVRGSVYYICEN